MCGSDTQQVSNLDAMYERLLNQRNELGIYYPLFLIMLRGGLRVSEVLGIKPADIINKHSILIGGSKGSSSKLVSVPELTELLQHWRKNHLYPFNFISRFQVYRMCKRFGIEMTEKGKKNNSVTHIFRKITVQELECHTKDLQVMADVIGHKSINSTKKYVKRK